MPATIRPLAGLFALLALAGCTMDVQPATGQPSTVVMRMPGTIEPSTRAPAIPLASQPAGEFPPPSGRYRVTATPLNSKGGRCGNTLDRNPWTVDGMNVRFGAFRGTIQPNGALRMQANKDFIQGRFFGAHFTGRFWRPSPLCSYALSVEPE